MSDTDTQACALCGLPVRGHPHHAVFNEQALVFCCSGCVMVYTMLMEVADTPDPAQFKDSDLYRRCVAAGVVPATESDLDQAIRMPPRDMTPGGESEAVETLPLQRKVAGMWCPACAWVVQSALEKVPGVTEAVCDFATDRLRCRYDPIQLGPDTIERVVRRLGYSPAPTDGGEKLSFWQSDFVRWMISALLSANVMMLSWALYSGFFTALSPEDIRYISWPILILSTIVMIYGGGPLFRSAWWGMRASAPGMELLVCIGAGSAYLYSCFNFLSGSWHLYFDTASMLITLVLLGKLLESKAKTRVRHDLEGFLALQPNKVRMCNPAYPQGRFVSLDQLTPGDAFRVKIDEMVPADGQVASGRGMVDESAVTGESRPKTVAPGDSITSGTILIEGDVTVTARRVGQEALIGQMIAIIEDNLSRQARPASRSDRWLGLFVPLMIALAVATMVITHYLGLSWEAGFERGLTVLVIACPCALGIAIPLARIGGMSAAGRRGILVKDIEAFTKAGVIHSLVMDKTGTLTQGNWSLSQLATQGMWTADEALAVAAGLEKEVDHAVARAVMAQARRQHVSPAQVTDVQRHPRGISGRYKGQDVRIGAWDFVAPGTPSPETTSLSNAPLSTVYLGADQTVYATLGFGDQLRSGSQSLIRYFQQLGKPTHLLSGDADPTTQAVAQMAGVDQAVGGLLPQEKAAYVKRLQSEGQAVVMMGDGINDAPALSSADLSVALHHEGALAQQAAAVTLMRSDPAQLVEFLELAKAVNAKVVQNLGCAWIYNLISIPIAMSGLLNPLVAVMAMLLSSLTVIGNTILLVRKK